MTLRLIATGGTFEKTYHPTTGKLGFDRSHLEDILARARIETPVTIEVVMLMDSLDMLDGHRQQILQACERAPEQQIVIVHGTDTMVETAAVLAAANLGRTIVLTGAMVPYSIKASDALFNLGYAAACAQHLAPGVWVAMNAVARPWDHVRKNRERGVFEGR